MLHAIADMGPQRFGRGRGVALQRGLEQGGGLAAAIAEADEMVKRLTSTRDRLHCIGITP